MAKKIYVISLKLDLCDRNRNFREIMESIYKAIQERDGVDNFIIIKEEETR